MQKPENNFFTKNHPFYLIDNREHTANTKEELYDKNKRAPDLTTDTDSFFYEKFVKENFKEDKFRTYNSLDPGELEDDESHLYKKAVFKIEVPKDAVRTSLKTKLFSKEIQNPSSTITKIAQNEDYYCAMDNSCQILNDLNCLKLEDTDDSIDTDNELNLNGQSTLRQTKKDSKSNRKKDRCKAHFVDSFQVKNFAFAYLNIEIKNLNFKISKSLEHIWQNFC